MMLMLALAAASKPGLAQSSGCYQPYKLEQRNIHYAFLRPLALVEANLPPEAARHYQRTERYAAQGTIGTYEADREALSFFVLELRAGQSFDAPAAMLDHARAAAAEAGLQTMELQKNATYFMGTSAAGVQGWLQDRNGGRYMLEVRCVGAGPTAVYVGVHLRPYKKEGACASPLQAFRYEAPAPQAPDPPADGLPKEHRLAVAGRQLRYVLPTALEPVPDSATGQVSHYQAETDQMLIGLQAKDTPLTQGYAQGLLAQIRVQTQAVGLRLREHAQVERRAFALPALAYRLELTDTETGNPAYGELRLVQLGNTTWELLAIGWGSDARQAVEATLSSFAW